MNKQNNKCLSIIVPCMNEQEMLKTTKTELISLLQNLIDNNLINSNSYICFIDDGSTDKTWAIIKNLCSEKDNVRGIKLSKNFGHQNALLAGLDSAFNDCDFSITIDADLQDDINVIPQMVEDYINGSEIVYGIRQSRKNDTLLKRLTAKWFYNFLSFIGSNSVKNHADFRLMGMKAMTALKQYNEKNIYLRGIIPNLGFQTSKVYYERKNRIAGTTKYPLKKMVSFAFDGVASQTVTPLRKLLIVGLVMLIFSITYIFHIIYVKFITGTAVPGWTSIILPIMVFGSFQLIAIGILGEYLAKLIMEVKDRPRYIIEEKVQ